MNKSVGNYNDPNEIKISFEDLISETTREEYENKIRELIKIRRSFKIVNLPQKQQGFNIIKLLESLMKEQKMRCRVYTKFRSLLLGSAIIPTPITIAIGGITALGISVHNLATYSPDFEIAKCGDQVIVYRKKVKIQK